MYIGELGDMKNEFDNHWDLFLKNANHFKNSFCFIALKSLWKFNSCLAERKKIQATSSDYILFWLHSFANTQ